MTGLKRRLGLSFAAACVLLTLVACGSRTINRAPVEERVTRTGESAGVVPVVKQPQGFEHAGKPGYYTVKPGDTLTRIALENGQSPRDIAAWSQVENLNRIEVGQVLRVMPPAGQEVQVQPVSRATVSAGALTQPAPAAPASVAPATATGETRPAPATDNEINWLWPTNGPVLAGFDDVKNKGLDIGGAAGDPVVAAADGKVVYTGEAIRGYGKLVILKHSNVYLTAYAHNQNFHVKEDQFVRRGQKIAEIGSTDTDRPKLHFEIRETKSGISKPVDPMKYLPAR